MIVLIRKYCSVCIPRVTPSPPPSGESLSSLCLVGYFALSYGSCHYIYLSGRPFQLSFSCGLIFSSIRILHPYLPDHPAVRPPCPSVERHLHGSLLFVDSLPVTLVPLQAFFPQHPLFILRSPSQSCFEARAVCTTSVIGTFCPAVPL